LEEKKKITSPLKAIRKYCLDCSNNHPSEIKDCPCVDCALYDFRFGKNPHSKRILTPEQRIATAERMRKMCAQKTK